MAQNTVTDNEMHPTLTIQAPSRRLTGKTANSKNHAVHTLDCAIKVFNASSRCHYMHHMQPSRPYYYQGPTLHPFVPLLEIPG